MRLIYLTALQIARFLISKTENKALRNFISLIFLKKEKIINSFSSHAYTLKNFESIRKLKNIHSGKSAVIIGMGPSLKIEDLDRFHSTISFACNKIYLAFNQTSWRPDYYSVSDTLVAKNSAELIKNLNLKKIFRDNTYEYLNTSDAMWVRDLKFIPKKIDDDSVHFWGDMLTGTFRGGTVICMQIQLAIWMGIKKK